MLSCELKGNRCQECIVFATMLCHREGDAPSTSVKVKQRACAEGCVVMRECHMCYQAANARRGRIKFLRETVNVSREDIEVAMPCAVENHQPCTIREGREDVVFAIV
jgi:hypothetical protein